MREPDWEALSDIQFAIYKRVADSLNAAMSAVALSDIPDAGGQSPKYWKERANTKIASVLNLFTAWEYLIRYKMGETIPDRAVRPFHVNALLAWLAGQLQLTATPVVDSNPELYANQETLQEALLLLYSAAFTQGTNVRLEMETSMRGMWFRIKFARNRALPDTFEELLASFGDHWRARDTVFELSMARDFVRLNGSELVMNSVDASGEFAFFVWRAGVKRDRIPGQADKTASELPADAVTQVMKESDLPQKPTTSEIKPAADATPVLPSEKTRTTPKPRLADVRPAHFPLPDSAFVPDMEDTVVPEPAASTTPEDASPDKAGQDRGIGESSATSQPEGHHAPPKQRSVTTAHISDHTPVIRLTPPRPMSVADLQAQAAMRAEAAKTPEPDAAKPAEKDVDTSPPSADAAASTPPREPIIVKAKIPQPELPSSLHRPPASTSTVALTTDTQTMLPIKLDGPPPSGDENATPPRGEADETPRADATSHGSQTPPLASDSSDSSEESDTP